ncbi:hypothetical protein ACH4D3_17655 [Streptomyces sp. NPDC018026]|uniref:hypothetical protein n=1 Tax=Streptomyces sp. NPDC018026 TaxID=3365031 RepID=UPI003795DDF8
MCEYCGCQSLTSIAELTREHDAVVAMAAEFPDRLLDALALLREHILKEQDGVFPAAPATLTTEQWEAVEAGRARAGSALPPPAA